MVIYKFQTSKFIVNTFRSHSFCGINDKVWQSQMKGGIHFDS